METVRCQSSPDVPLVLLRCLSGLNLHLFHSSCFPEERKRIVRDFDERVSEAEEVVCYNANLDVSLLA